MSTIRKNHFFSPMAMLLGVFGLLFCLSLNAPPASAVGYCSKQGTRTVTYTDQQISLGTYPYFQSLKWGSAGECVKTLQRMVNPFCTEATKLQVDGEFGPKTYSAVKTIQYNVGHHWVYPVYVNGSRISVDGQVGPQTWSILQAFSWWGSAYGLDCTSIK